MSASLPGLELIQKYLDRVATPDEFREMDARLVKDRAFAREFVQISRLHAHLHEYLEALPKRVPISLNESIGEPAPAKHIGLPKARRPVFRIARFGGALAAAVVIAIGLAYLDSRGGVVPEPGPDGESFTKITKVTEASSPLQVASFNGRVEIRNEGSSRVVTAGVSLLPGDTVWTAEGASAVLAMQGTATQVRLGSGSRLTIVECEKDLALRSTVGQFEVNVDPTAGRSFWLDTTHAEYDVMGTRFKATVTEEESRIEVEVGKVIFSGKDIESGAPMLLAASSYAVARRGVPIEAGFRGRTNGPLLRLVCRNAHAKDGETFSVSLRVLRAPPFASWGQTLRFNPEHLALVKQEAGTFPTFLSDSRQPAIINASGEVHAGGVGLEDNSGGSGVLGTFTFKVLKAVPTTISTVPKSEENQFGNLLLDMKGRKVLPVSVGELVINKGR